MADAAGGPADVGAGEAVGMAERVAVLLPQVAKLEAENARLRAVLGEEHERVRLLQVERARLQERLDERLEAVEELSISLDRYRAAAAAARGEGEQLGLAVVQPSPEVLERAELGPGEVVLVTHPGARPVMLRGGQVVAELDTDGSTWKPPRGGWRPTVLAVDELPHLEATGRLQAAAALSRDFEQLLDRSVLASAEQVENLVEACLKANPGARPEDLELLEDRREASVTRWTVQRRGCAL